MNWCSVMFAAVMFVDCVAVWDAADAAAVLADVLVLSVATAAVLAAVTVWNAVVELPAAAASAASVAVAACFAVKCVHGSAAELVHVAEWMPVESAAVNAVTAAVKPLAVHV